MILIWITIVSNNNLSRSLHYGGNAVITEVQNSD